MLAVCSFCLILNSFRRKDERVEEEVLKDWNGAVLFISDNSCRILSEILQVAARCEDGSYDFETIQRIRHSCFGDLKEESINPRMAVSRESKVIMQFVLSILQYVYALEAEKNGESKVPQKRHSVNKARSPLAGTLSTASVVSQNESLRNFKEDPPAPEDEVRIKPLKNATPLHGTQASDRSGTPCSLKHHRSSAV